MMKRGKLAHPPRFDRSLGLQATWQNKQLNPQLWQETIAGNSDQLPLRHPAEFAAK